MGLHKRAGELYGAGNLMLAGDIPDTQDVQDAFDRAAKWVHEKEGFTPGMLKDDPVASLISATARYLSAGIEKGVENTDVSTALTNELKASTGMFSGFKAFHQMKEAAAMLVDDNGNIKPFEQYFKDVRTINESYNKNYLRTEYNFTVTSAEMAAKWEEQQDDDQGRYLLQYRTAGDGKVRKAHRELEGITLPATDPFWDKYYPPNGWNCRCSVAKVRASKYPATDASAAMDAGDNVTSGKHAEMFRFNPGKQRAAYPAYNTYTISKCSTCTKSGKLELAKAPGNELCAACPIIREQAKFITEPSKGGELRVHLLHGEDEREENVRIARYFTDKYGQEIDLLPRSHTQKCADAYNRTLKQLQEYKQCSTPTKNAIDLAIRDANQKSDHIILLISTDISEENLTRGIKGRMLQAKRLQSVTIVKDGKDVVYTKEEIIQKGFKASWADLK